MKKHLLYALVLMILINTNMLGQNLKSTNGNEPWKPSNEAAWEALKAATNYDGWVYKPASLNELTTRTSAPCILDISTVAYVSDGQKEGGRKQWRDLDLSNNNLVGTIPLAFSIWDDPANSADNEMWATFNNQGKSLYFSYNKLTAVNNWLIVKESVGYIEEILLDHNNIESIDFHNPSDPYGQNMDDESSNVVSTHIKDPNTYTGVYVFKLNHNELRKVTPENLANPKVSLNDHNGIDYYATLFRIDNNRLSFNSLIDINAFVRYNTRPYRYNRVNNDYCNFKMHLFPQKALGNVVEAVTKNAGTTHDLTFSINDAHPDNIYTWTLNGKDLPLSENISYSINDLDATKAGIYRCKITNPNLPGEALYSQDMPVFLNKSGNRKPTSINLPGTKIAKGVPFGSIISDLTGVDPDGDQVYFRLLDNVKDNSSFRIVNGKTLVTADILFEYDYKQSYQITIEAYDIYGGIYSKDFTITKGTSSETISIPTNVTVSTSSFAENISNTRVANIQLEDAIVGEYNISLSPGIYDNDNFEIKNGNQLFVKESYNYEVDQKALKVRLKLVSTDGLTTLYFDVLLNVTDANDAPNDILLPIDRFPVSMPVGMTVSPLIGIDEDVIDTDFTIELVDKTSLDNVDFAIVRNVLKSAKIFSTADVGAKTVRVKVTDPAGAIFTKDLTVQIYDPNQVNDQNTAGPSGIGFDNMLINRQSSVGSKVCKLFVEDVDGGTDYTYSLLEDDATQNEYFKIVGKQLQIAKQLRSDISNYSIHIEVNDGDYTYDGTYLFYALNGATPVDPAMQLKSVSKVYPNPCNNQVNVQVENEYIGDVIYEIYDTTGKLQYRTVLQKNNEKQIATLDCSSLVSGLYVVRIISDKEIETVRIRKN